MRAKRRNQRSDMRAATGRAVLDVPWKPSTLTSSRSRPMIDCDSWNNQEVRLDNVIVNRAEADRVDRPGPTAGVPCSPAARTVLD
jgi:hypothetical protein